MKLDSSWFPTKTFKEIHLYKDETSTLKIEFIVYGTDNISQLDLPSKNINTADFTYTAKEGIKTSIPSKVLDIYQI